MSDDMDLREAACICAELASVAPNIGDARVKGICDGHQGAVMAELAVHDERVRAEAWAEGYRHCFDVDEAYEDGVSLRDNPYRVSAPSDEEAGRG
jgi:hypothetical protein